MSIEHITQTFENNSEANHLFPERPSYSAEKNLKEILEYLSGEREKEVLTDEEKIELIAFEEPFVDKLAEAYSIEYNTKTLYPEYFDTPEGQDSLKELDIISELYPDNNTPIDIRTNIDILRKLDPESLAKLGEKGLKHHTETMLENLSHRIAEDGSLDIEGLDNPEKLMFIKKPEELTRKIESLRALKSELKQERSTLFQEEASITNREPESISESSELLHAKLYSLKHLIKKVNVLLVKTLEDKAILDTEEDLTSHQPKYKLDKFIYGVGKMNAEGNYDQIDSRLLQKADEIAEEHIRLNQEKSSILAEQGLDVKKMEAQSVEPEQIKIYLDRILSEYGLLSESTADQEQVDNNIKPTDNKWRCYIKPNQSVFEIDSKSKTLFIPTKNRSIIDVLTKGATHEIIHILQRENTAEIELPLYTNPQQMGGDRSDLFQEGGAMYYQDQASQELFNFDSPPGPHYLRAMAVKQAGGDYLACVKAYYESSISVNPKKSKLALKTALSSARRLFRNSINFDNTDRSIPSTKDTIYLEQKAVVEKILKYPELENLILVSGMNLETAKEMIHFGLLDLSRLRTPDLSYVQKLWEEVKPNYTL
ncbi:MAG: hypothetical protein WD512_18215, partial [Candidatus Paceibacterota bacterium]